ncbi:MAG: hypothetical protein HYY84_07675 [Deltaproteobacteria bacterium]|nr:hypothetical protein [Deltaproteobacteria bacterium]
MSDCCTTGDPKKERPLPTDPDALVCYCFNIHVREVSAETRGFVTEKCRKGENRCAELNPTGLCCLGDFAQILAAERAKK